MRAIFLAFILTFCQAQTPWYTQNQDQYIQANPDSFKQALMMANQAVGVTYQFTKIIRVRTKVIDYQLIEEFTFLFTSQTSNNSTLEYTIELTNYNHKEQTIMDALNEQNQQINQNNNH